MPDSDIVSPVPRIVADRPAASDTDAETWLMVPGLGGSGPRHWQTLWEEERAGTRRFRPDTWDRPSRGSWIAALNRAIDGADGPVVLVAHSLGCITVAHWVGAATPALLGKVTAALLVAPPDVTHPDIDPRVHGFAPPPTTPLPFPALLVASEDDPYCALDRAAALAQGWNTGFRDVGARGHVNADSGLGDWPEGKALLASIPRQPRCKKLPRP